MGRQEQACDLRCVTNCQWKTSCLVVMRVMCMVGKRVVIVSMCVCPISLLPW